jgi:hypothetical protein
MTIGNMPRRSGGGDRRCSIDRRSSAQTRKAKESTKHNVVALAKAAKALKLPIVVTTTARDSMWGPTFPELVEALPYLAFNHRPIDGHAWDDPKVAAAIEARGRSTARLICLGRPSSAKSPRPTASKARRRR